MTTYFFRVQVKTRYAKKALSVLKKRYLTLSAVVRSLIVQTARDNELPFDTFVPNEETARAMRAAQRGEVFHVGAVEDMSRLMALWAAQSKKRRR